MRLGVVAVVLLLLAACANPLEGGAEGVSGGEIVIGSSDVGESLLLAHIYAGTLRHAGAENVTVRPPVGGREVVVKALRDRSLSLVPEYSGNLLRYFDPDTTATTPEEVYAELRRVLPERFQVLEPAPAQDTDVLVIRPELAAQGISTISELAPRCPELVFGGPGQWADRWKEKIDQVYGCRFREIRVTDTGGPVTVAALRSGEIDVADLFSTSATIESNGFVPLVDDRNMFPAQNIVPLAARGTLGEREVRALDELSAVLTTEKLTRLNVEFTELKRNPLDIAEDFLRENGLLAASY
ncbi:osmoprotectant transport system substrate-binding protein [Amycolatopsis arida]|uniref:Osmoprotectant transport system substrate-binding protein n=1 Tax=Amycolatopsis arida TaxID=587909 RepID=A0A1I5PFT5_9PSEU|nr:ABC transporter substrate-binding protein [Amycolatopsis arida]TDX98486.1 osmoprotectant transport system substrate-binding protein [Amycolatopsis arida]SFP32964.1 osmoprotectant transport system substrate-binding protein [Amycolatopsis arida]